MASLMTALAITELQQKNLVYVTGRQMPGSKSVSLASANLDQFLSYAY
jgi:hypothetical protein